MVEHNLRFGPPIRRLLYVRAVMTFSQRQGIRQMTLNQRMIAKSQRGRKRTSRAGTSYTDEGTLFRETKLQWIQQTGASRDNIVPGPDRILGKGVRGKGLVGFGDLRCRHDGTQQFYLERCGVTSYRQAAWCCIISQMPRRWKVQFSL